MSARSVIEAWDGLAGRVARTFSWYSPSVFPSFAVTATGESRSHRRCRVLVAGIFYGLMEDTAGLRPGDRAARPAADAPVH
jgi:hypothetical protein